MQIRLIADGLNVLPPRNPEMVSVFHLDEWEEAGLRNKIWAPIFLAAGLQVDPLSVYSGVEIYAHNVESIARALTILRHPQFNGITPVGKGAIRVATCLHRWVQKLIVSEGCKHVALPREMCWHCIRKDQERYEAHEVCAS